MTVSLFKFSLTMCQYDRHRKITLRNLKVAKKLRQKSVGAGLKPAPTYRLGICWFNRPRLNRNVWVQATSPEPTQRISICPRKTRKWLNSFRFFSCVLWVIGGGQRTN